MKKLCVLATFLLLGLTQYGSAQIMDGSFENQGNIDPNCEYPAGPCVCECPYVKYNPQYYYTTHCYQEPYCVYKKCCRKVAQPYCVTKCKMVPQYYQVQCCRYVNEYYCVPETRYCTKSYRQCHCRYIPCTYTKRTCCYPNQCGQGGCGIGGGSEGYASAGGCALGGGNWGGHAQYQAQNFEQQDQQMPQYYRNAERPMQR